MNQYNNKIEKLLADHEVFLSQKNEPIEETNGLFIRYKNPAVTAAHTPVIWRYDLDEKSNPYLMERIGMNAAMNSGAIKWNGKYILVVRVEGADRKSFFAVAESPNGIDNFRFWDYPVTMPDTEDPATNIYDMQKTMQKISRTEQAILPILQKPAMVMAQRLRNLKIEPGASRYTSRLGGGTSFLC